MQYLRYIVSSFQEEMTTTLFRPVVIEFHGYEHNYYESHKVILTMTWNGNIESFALLERCVFNSQVHHVQFTSATGIYTYYYQNDKLLHNGHIIERPREAWNFLNLCCASNMVAAPGNSSVVLCKDNMRILGQVRYQTSATPAGIELFCRDLLNVLQSPLFDTVIIGTLEQFSHSENSTGNSTSCSERLSLQFEKDMNGNFSQWHPGLDVRTNATSADVVGAVARHYESFLPA